MTTAATWQATDIAGLRRLTATAGPAGVILGRDFSGELTPVPLLRPEPTRVVLVGGPWATRLMVFRCLAVGCRVVVTTVAPARWTNLAEIAGSTDRVWVLPAHGTADLPLGPPGSVQPVLHVNDIGLGTPGSRPPLGPWQTSLTVLPVLTAQSASNLTDANIVVLQRLGADEAELCASSLRLAPAAGHRLQQMHDEMLVVISGNQIRYLTFSTTSVEDQLLGPPRRAERSVLPGVGASR
jgi:hypothetical protein